MVEQEGAAVCGEAYGGNGTGLVVAVNSND